MTKEPAYIAAHDRAIHHRAEVEASDSCGCFFCLAVYPPASIVNWVDKGATALCPRCGIDSVIGTASGYPITKDFLLQMRDHWFQEVPQAHLPNAS